MMRGIVTDDSSMSITVPLPNPRPESTPLEQGHRLLACLTGHVYFDEDLPTGQVAWAGDLEGLTGDPEEAFHGLGTEVLEARIHPEDRHAVLHTMLEAIQSCRGYSAEFRLMHRDGTPRRARLRGRILAGHDGRPRRSLGVLEDLTELRCAQHEREELERQMLHAQKLESLGVLAGGIAHDFNNILTAAIGNLNLAQLKLSPESAAHPHLESLERTLLRASDLTRQMLAYSGRGRCVVQRHHINQIVQEIHHLLSVVISKRIAVRLQLAERLPAIEADATQVQQVLLNLVTNANDAIGDRDGTIRITTESVVLDEDFIRTTLPGWPIQPGPHAMLEISDNGCGMTPDVLSHIFEPFFSTKASGRGLGLSAMLSILRGHGAGLKVYSEPGRGTTFKLFFPAALSSEELEGAPDPRKDQRQGTVLVVDDEFSVLETTSQALEMIGFRTLQAKDGAEAVSRVEQQGACIDLVLMDLTMPTMDGREAFRRIRHLRPEIPVVLTSGFQEAESVEGLQGKGLAGFLQKPYLLKDLRKVVEGAVKR